MPQNHFRPIQFLNASSGYGFNSKKYLQDMTSYSGYTRYTLYIAANLLFIWKYLRNLVPSCSIWNLEDLFGPRLGPRLPQNQFRP